MLPPVFLDTSFIIALENPHDEHHVRAHELDSALTDGGRKYVLHAGILCEIGDGFARLERRQRGNFLLSQFLLSDGYEVVMLSNDLLADGAKLYQSRPDKTWGLTDCISFVVMRQHSIVAALTADVHFQQAGFQAMLLES